MREKTDIAKMKDQSSLRAFNAYVFPSPAAQAILMQLKAGEPVCLIFRM